MKNLILKNYDINIDKIVLKDDNTFFFYNNIKIYIVLYNDEITNLEYLFRLSNELYFNGIKINTFLLNNESKMYTKIDSNNIVLMRENQIENDVCINDLLKFERINNNLKSFNI